MFEQFRKKETQAIPGDVIGEILAQAREVIKARGWRAGGHISASSAVCIGNAMAEAIQIRDGHRNRWISWTNVPTPLIRALGFRSISRMTSWNDRLGGIFGSEKKGRKKVLERIEWALQQRLIDYEPPAPIVEEEPPLTIPVEWEEERREIELIK